MIQRNYDSLKFKRTYIGGSKEKELEIFDRVQHTNGKCDWFEYRRILFPYLDDVMHVAFSRSFISKKLSFILLGVSLILGLLHLPVFSAIIVTIAIIFRISNIFFERTIKETLLSYDMSVDIVKNQIKIVSGLDI